MSRCQSSDVKHPMIAKRPCLVLGPLPMACRGARAREEWLVAKGQPKTTDKPIKPGRIRTVLTTLGREIAQDQIPAGTALPPEPDLEARFGVGRGVVREAIKTLAAKGLVSVRPRHGTHVLPRHEWSLLDRDVLSWLVGEAEPDRELLLSIQEVRSIIEPAAAALAATRATADDRRRINAALAAME